MQKRKEVKVKLSASSKQKDRITKLFFLYILVGKGETEC